MSDSILIWVASRDVGMATGRQKAFDAIVRISMERSRFGIPAVCDRSGDVSRRTVRRALKDAESLGWVEKPSAGSHRWVPGEKAREFRIAGRWTDDDVELPRMFFVPSWASVPEFLHGEDVLLSAGAAWRASGSGFSLGVPDARCLYADSGGYQAAVYFREGYPYSPAEYHEWADRIGAQYVFGMDWACEDGDVLAEVADLDDEAASEIPDVATRLEWSWRDQLAQFEEYQSGRYSHRFAPVVQGQSVDEYREFASRLADSVLPTDGLVGVGTICKRGSVDEIEEVIGVLESELPAADFHLFGATLDVWKDERLDGRFVSSDTASWVGWGPGSGKWPSSMDERREAYESYADRVREIRAGGHSESSVGSASKE